MLRIQHLMSSVSLLFLILFVSQSSFGQDLPPKYPMLELFTNTPCPICGSQNPGLFNRLGNFEGEYHLVSFYPGKPYSSCIFYQANTAENNERYQYYSGSVFGTPTVAINGTDFPNSSGVNNTVLNNITGLQSPVQVKVDETTGSSRFAEVTMIDHSEGSVESARLFAVIVEKEILYNAPNGETVHHNVFRSFLGPVGGEVVDLSGGIASKTYAYDVENEWQADQIYVIAWLTATDSKEILNSGSRFDPDFISSVGGPGTANSISMYPNPAVNQFVISIPEYAGSAEVSIFDLQGKRVFSNTYSGGEQPEINAAGWPAGMYLVSLQIGGRTLEGKVQIVDAGN